MRFAMEIPPLNHGKAVQKVILVLLHCPGILLSNGNDRLINADKLPSLQIVYILKIDDVGTVDSFKGSGKKLLFQILNVAVKLNRRPIFQMNFNNSVFTSKYTISRSRTEPMILPNL